jgi:hypothetical protein
MGLYYRVVKRNLTDAHDLNVIIDQDLIIKQYFKVEELKDIQRDLQDFQRVVEH